VARWPFRMPGVAAASSCSDCPPREGRQRCRRPLRPRRRPLRPPTSDRLRSGSSAVTSRRRTGIRRVTT